MSRNEDAESDFVAGRDLCDRRRWSAGLELLTRAAECGHLEAAFELGMHYLELEDQPSAIKWFRVAAEANDVEAAYRLGLSLTAEGELGEAVYWWRMAAQAGHSRAASCLAAMEGGMG